MRLHEAKKFALENDYSKVFTIIKYAIKILPDNERLTVMLNEFHADFETVITNTANTLVKEEKYAQAMETVNQALAVSNSDNLQLLKKEIEKKKEASNEYTAPKVEFITYKGDISSKNDVDQYSLHASEGGCYRFDFSDMFSGFKVNISVYEPDGTCIASSSYGIMKNGGITAELKSGKTYTIKIRHYENTGDYVLTIGQQKKVINITNKDIVHDGIEYTKQKNRYDITAEYSGKYRFDFVNVYSGFKANITVFDDYNYVVASSNYGLGNNQGLSVELEAGKTYRVVVYQYESTSSYDFYIGKQSATQQIRSGTSIASEMTFTNQKNRYSLIVDSDGTYTFTLSGMNSGFKCNITIFDDHNYRIADSSYGLGNEQSITAVLEKGKEYRIVVYQYQDTGEYTLTVGK